MEAVLEKINAFTKSGQDFLDGVFRRRNPVFSLMFWDCASSLAFIHCVFFFFFERLFTVCNGNFRLKSLNGCREKRFPIL